MGKQLGNQIVGGRDGAVRAKALRSSCLNWLSQPLFNGVNDAPITRQRASPRRLLEAKLVADPSIIAAWRRADASAKRQATG
ncbi:hypothetical protein [Sphingomonas sp. DC2300-3]|uniref:hypothetical protein n=1 Tax=unclassified Sphingomonas TaxID=196159 RepID=UPI003CF521A3